MFCSTEGEDEDFNKFVSQLFYQSIEGIKNCKCAKSPEWKLYWDILDHYKNYREYEDNQIKKQ